MTVSGEIAAVASAAMSEHDLGYEVASEPSVSTDLWDYLKAGFILLSTSASMGTIQGQELFKGGNHSRKYGMYETTRLLLSSLTTSRARSLNVSLAYWSPTKCMCAAAHNTSEGKYMKDLQEAMIQPSDLSMQIMKHLGAKWLVELAKCSQESLEPQYGWSRIG